jgi:aryl-phospho-beta-D-glucosidase BglC (GH1 family)
MTTLHVARPVASNGVPCNFRTTTGKFRAVILAATGQTGLVHFVRVVLMVAHLTSSAAIGREGVAQPMMRWRIGINLSALENGDEVPGIANTDYALPTDAEFDFLRSKNLTFVRLPFKWERLQPTRSGPLDPTYLGYIQAAVAMAAARGMKIALDCHNYGGYGADKIGGGVVTSADFADLWSRLAAVFAGDSTIAAYDIMNEPSNMSTLDAWQPAAQAAIDAIRAIDATSPIYVEGNNYSSASTWVDQNPTLHQLNDPSDLLIFSAHIYLDRDNSGTHYSWAEEVAAGDQLTGLPLDKNIGVRRVAGFVGWLRQHRLNGNIGETGAGLDDPDWLSALDREIAFLLDNDVTFIYWNLGPFFTSYPYSIEPDVTGIDKVQVAVLTKYTNAAQPATYTLTKSAPGPVGMPSSEFTISYRGLIKTPITFIANDGGAGGRFMPDNITMPAGFNGVVNFTYIPPQTNIYMIGVTNNAGLTDPPAVLLD